MSSRKMTGAERPLSGADTPVFSPLPLAELDVFHCSRSTRNLADLLHLEARGRTALLGCGSGEALPYFSQAERIHAVDANYRALEKLKTRCQANQWSHVQPLHADLAHYCLPEPAQLSLMILSFAPETLQDSVRILCNVQSQTLSDHPLLMILPSIEAQLYWQHLQYRFYFEQGEDETRLQRLLQQANRDGLASAGPGGVAGQRCWSKEELINLVMSLRFKPLSLEKHYLPWESYFPGQPWFHHHRPLWHWRLTLLAP